MTTIAYHHKDKEIAVDSRFTRDSVISTDNANKIIKKDGVTFVLSGYCKSYADLVDMWFSGEANKSIECTAFVVSEGSVYEYGLDSEKCISCEKIEENLTKGSGDYWALAAMDFGCSAKEAVKYAITRDIYSGGKVRVINVK